MYPCACGGVGCPSDSVSWIAPSSSLDPVELAILRIGVCELAYQPEIPFRVIINEAVELAKVFGAEQSHRYINGVMDKVARELRRAELKMNTR